jgi:hypothetical protein
LLISSLAVFYARTGSETTGNPYGFALPMIARAAILKAEEA